MLREDQHRSDGIDEEIEEFRGPADDDADRDLARIDLIMIMRASTPDRRRGGRCGIRSHGSPGLLKASMGLTLARTAASAALGKLSNTLDAAVQLTKGKTRHPGHR